MTIIRSYIWDPELTDCVISIERGGTATLHREIPFPDGVNYIWVWEDLLFIKSEEPRQVGVQYEIKGVVKSYEDIPDEQQQITLPDPNFEKDYTRALNSDEARETYINDF